MEKWDLYNAKREKSGITVCRGEIIPKGLYHLSVNAFLQSLYPYETANIVKILHIFPSGLINQFFTSGSKQYS